MDRSSYDDLEDQGKSLRGLSMIFWLTEPTHTNPAKSCGLIWRMTEPMTFRAQGASAACQTAVVDFRRTRGSNNRVNAAERPWEKLGHLIKHLWTLDWSLIEVGVVVIWLPFLGKRGSILTSSCSCTVSKIGARGFPAECIPMLSSMVFAECNSSSDVSPNM